MSKRIAGVGLTLVLAVGPVSGCGADIAVDNVVASDSQPTPKISPKPTFPSGDAVDDDDDEMEPLVTAYDKRYEEWLQSDYVRKLDLRKVITVPLDADAPGDFESFEAVVDASSDVVSGKVSRVVCVPYGIVTFFQVDRKAKGDVPVSKEIAVYQENHLYPLPGQYPKGPFGEPRLAVDPARSLLLPGDRAVLLLTIETPGKTVMEPQAAKLAGLAEGRPTYTIWHKTGQYKSKNGIVKAEVGNKQFSDVDGTSEDALIDRAEKRAKAGKG